MRMAFIRIILHNNNNSNSNMYVYIIILHFDSECILLMNICNDTRMMMMQQQLCFFDLHFKNCQ